MLSDDPSDLLDDLGRFTAEHWVGEPADVARLRSFSLPPMGNLPCVLYCNFDLFWAGEQIQVCRQAALDGTLSPGEAAKTLALLLDRTAARLAKWEMAETVTLVTGVAAVLRDWEPTSAKEFSAVSEALMIVLDRIQAAIDAIIPWNDLDRSLRLRPPPVGAGAAQGG
jgi:hypothetical protein